MGKTALSLHVNMTAHISSSHLSQVITYDCISQNMNKFQKLVRHNARQFRFARRDIFTFFWWNGSIGPWADLEKIIQELEQQLLLHPFNGLFSRTTWVSRYKKGKASLDLNEARWGWQWHQLDHTQTTSISLQTDNHTNTSSLNFYRPDALPDVQTNSVKALKAVGA